MQPNPLQYLAYWAGRTRRVDVGTAVIVAPWWNPVRLASEISMLDILLKGRRLHLGIGGVHDQHDPCAGGAADGSAHHALVDDRPLREEAPRLLIDLELHRHVVDVPGSSEVVEACRSKVVEARVPDGSHGWVSCRISYRFQPSQSQTARPMTSSRSRPFSQGSSSVNSVTH